ncbi:MAG: SDR family oxidoreductase [Cyclobacteriaceae bacterium]|nr:SDR family oxidoreductase [Cyclobacteriaceae bacterium]
MLTNKKLIVVGGTTGLGLSAARAFLAHGALVTVIGRNSDSCHQAREALGSTALVIQGDATHEDTVPRAIQQTVALFGGFDGLYHVAGGSGRKMGDGPLHELTLEGWNKTMELNLTSLMLSNQAAVRAFLETGHPGVILNMSSVLGFSPSVKYFSTHAYATAKAAIIGFSKSLAAYYATHNIRVNVVAPALVETPMAQRAATDPQILQFIQTKQPLDGGRIGHPADLDGAACYLMSDMAAFVTGQVLAIDGGWSSTEGQFPLQS